MERMILYCKQIVTDNKGKDNLDKGVAIVINDVEQPSTKDNEVSELSSTIFMFSKIIIISPMTSLSIG